MNWNKLASMQQADSQKKLAQLKTLQTPDQIINQIILWGQQEHIKSKIINSNIGQLEYGHGTHTFAIIVTASMPQIVQTVAAYQAFGLLKKLQLPVRQRLRLIIFQNNDPQILQQYLNTTTAPQASIVAADNSPFDPTTNFTFNFAPSSHAQGSYLDKLHWQSDTANLQIFLMTVNWQEIHQKWFHFINQYPFQGHLDIAERQVKITISSTLHHNISLQPILEQFLLKLPLDSGSRQFLLVLHYLLNSLLPNSSFEAFYQQAAGGWIKIIVPHNAVNSKDLQDYYQSCYQLSQHYQAKFQSNIASIPRNAKTNHLSHKILAAYQEVIKPTTSQLVLRPSCYHSILNNSFAFGNLLVNDPCTTCEQLTLLTAAYDAVLARIACTK